MDYYSNINADLLNRIPAGLTHVLEVGCGRGKLAEAYIARNPDVNYYGIELNAEAASDASQLMKWVIAGDVESDGVLQELKERTQGVRFDAVVLGDILEHLKDPWKTLAQLCELSAPGATCLTCLPNVAHWTILKKLLEGNWDYEASGLLDQTHLRFFTLKSARELFHQAGWNVVDEHALIQGLSREEQYEVRCLLELANRLSIDLERAKRDMLAYQWILVGVKSENN